MLFHVIFVSREFTVLPVVTLLLCAFYVRAKVRSMVRSVPWTLPSDWFIRLCLRNAENAGKSMEVCKSVLLSVNSYIINM